MIRTIPNWNVDIRLVNKHTSEMSNISMKISGENLMDTLHVLDKIIWFPREVISVFIERDKS